MSILTAVGSAPYAPSSVVQFATLLPTPPAPVALVFTPSFVLRSGSGSVSFPPVSCRSFCVRHSCSGGLLGRHFGFPAGLSSWFSSSTWISIS